MTTDPLDPGTIDIDFGVPAETAQAEAEAREAASEAALDRTVRAAAEAAYSKPDQPLPTPHQSMDQTISDAMLRISRREPPASMPLRPGASIDETVDEAALWNQASKADQRALSDAHREVAALKAAAESYNVKVETAADLVALRNLMDRGKQANGLDPDLSEALSPGAPDKALPALRQTVQAIQADPVGGTRQLLDNMQVHPLQLLSQQEAAALNGSYGGELGAVVAANANVLQGANPAQAFQALLVAQEMSVRDPRAFIQEFARQSNVDLSQLGGGDQAIASLVDHWVATKGDNYTPEVEARMVEILPDLQGDGNPLNRLQAAYTEARRQLAKEAKRDPSKRLEDRVDETAAGIYGKRGR